MLCLLFILVFLLECSTALYKDHKIIRIEDDACISFIGLQILRRDEQNITLLVPPEDMCRVEACSVPFHILDNDLQLSIDNERHDIQTFSLQKDTKTWTENYHDYNDTLSWYHNLSMQYPDRIKLTENLTTTFENRQLFSVQITRPDTPYPSHFVWLQSMLHAREWISGAVLNYIVQQLVENPESIPQDVGFILIPICNPDGYHFSWTNNRLWRKNRRSGIGVDLNRNFDSFWTKDPQISPFADTFGGPYAASEPEVQALQSLFISHHDKIILALDLHSYAKQILWPWSYSDIIHPLTPEYMNLTTVLLNLLNDDYSGIKSSELYEAPGVASDFFAEKGGQTSEKHTWSLSIELPPSRQEIHGYCGFIQPRYTIKPTAALWLQAILHLVPHILKLRESKVQFQHGESDPTKTENR